jgi:small subunit ribosomal protein S11e
MRHMKVICIDGCPIYLKEKTQMLNFCSHTGTYIDKKCPFTGTVSIRGRIIAGTCHSAKMNRTIIVRRNYLHFVKKYQR